MSTSVVAKPKFERPTKFVSKEFIEELRNLPVPNNAISEFTFYRTYSRYIEELGRRETWLEAAVRAGEYSVELAMKQLKKAGKWSDDLMPIFVKEAEDLIRNMYQLKVFVSGRTLYTGGSKAAELYPLSNFNCFHKDTEFITDKGIKRFSDFQDGDVVNVLSATGGWKPATVRNFGKSELVELVVRKGTREEVIKTTLNHRWYVRKNRTEKKYVVKTTAELKPGDILRTHHETEEELLWKVKEIRRTGEVDDVWCVQEPETESFTLANGILTKNCSAAVIDTFKKIGEMFYLLMVGK